MTHVGYARTSTQDQSRDLQTDALTAAGCERLFEEAASGARLDRPELAACLDYLRPGDTLVVWRLDRLGRSLPHLIQTVNDLAARDVGFRSLTEGFDTTTAGGQLVFHVFGAMAEFERALIRERTVAGLAAARARGRVGGRPSTCTPAKLDRARQLVAARELTMQEIAALLGVKRSTLYRWLSAPSAATAAPQADRGLAVSTS